MEDFGLVDFRVTKLNPRNWSLPDGTTRFPIIYPRVYTLFICLIALVFQITTTPPNFFFDETYASWLEGARASARIQSLPVTLHPNGWVNHHGKLSVHCLNLNRPRGEGGNCQTVVLSIFTFIHFLVGTGPITRRSHHAISVNISFLSFYTRCLLMLFWTIIYK